MINTKEYLMIIATITFSSVMVTIILIDYFYKMSWGFIR